MNHHSIAMRQLFIAFLLVLSLHASAASRKLTVWISRALTENRVNPMGLDTARPRFSWQMESTEKNVRQTAYELEVASSIEKLNRGEADLYKSGVQQTDQQLWTAYRGKPLKSRSEGYWRVRVTTTAGQTAWSQPQHFSIALLGETHWGGRWIGLEGLQPGEQLGMHTRLAARYLRKEYQAKGEISRATAYIAGLGTYALFVNGQRVGQRKAVDGQQEVQEVLQPVPSDYRKTIYYNTYDITSLAQSQQGRVAVGVVLGNGRQFPMRYEKSYKVPFFGYPKCRVNIVVEYADGQRETWASDPSWRLTTDGPIRSNNEYDGELYDARRELKGWTLPGFDDSRWQQAERCAVPDGTLRAQTTEGMVERLLLSPERLRSTKRIPQGIQSPLFPANVNTPGHTIFDFRQNMAGWVSLNVRGQQGDTIRIRYAEKLNADGTLYRDNLRNAQSEDIYVCSGSEASGTWWRPMFVYHGFRYVEIIGQRDVKPHELMAYTVGDDMQTIGQMTTSSPVLNQVLKNAWWGIASNYKGMPVDCPQRNERQPWLGDRTMGALGESFLFDNERLYSKWMADLSEGVRPDGSMSNVTPAFWNYYEDNMTWPAAFPFICQMLHRQFGNAQPARQSYAAISRWMRHMLSEYERGGIITRDKYGDWCVPPEKLELIHSQDPARQTDGSLISTAYGIHIARLLQQFNQLLDAPSEADAAEWKAVEDRLAKAFNERFLTCKRGTSLRPGHVYYPDSVFYGNNTATANLLPLSLGIVPEDCKEEVVKNLVENIMVRGDGHVTCGVIGISWLLRGLADNGFADVAYLLATTNTYPSWGYMAAQGATTIWELWNGDKANPAMNSGNHVMLLGDLIPWAYEHLGGIRQQPGSVGYQRIDLRPDFTIPDCDSINARYRSPYGLIVSHWVKTLNKVEWHVELPVGTSATVHLPDGSEREIGSGQYDFAFELPTASPAIVKDERLWTSCEFPHAHASTIVETKKGDLLVAYFGGTWERNPNVCIYVSRKAKGKDGWEAPVLAADGVFELGSADALLARVDSTTTLASAGPIKPRQKGWAQYKKAIASWHYDFPQTKEAGAKALEDIKTAVETQNVASPHPSLPAFNKSLRRKACWNPVLYEMPDGELLLFFKIGSTVGDWTGWVVKSRDGGRTWADREPLPEGFIGPVKNKPELIGGQLLCGSSTENDGWRFHVERMDMASKQWTTTGRIAAREAMRTDDVLPAAHMELAQPKEGEHLRPIYSIQPSILKLKDGRLMVLMRTHNARLAKSYSSDGGETWSEVELTDIPNNQSGTDAVTLKDGRHALIYNDFETLPGTKKGPRTPISIALSDDDGQSFRHALTLEQSPISQYSYPAIIQGRNGHLYCVYTWRRQGVAFKEIDLDKLK